MERTETALSPSSDAVVRVHPRQLHRGVTILAGAVLLQTTYSIWRVFNMDRPRPAAVMGLQFVVLVAIIAVAILARRTRTLVRADIALLVIAIGNQIVANRAMFSGPRTYVIDESILTQRASAALAHGHNPYTQQWLADLAPRPTLLMNGHIADSWGYPPFSLELNAAAQRLFPSIDSISLVSVVAMIAIAVFGFVVFPAQLRGLIVVAVFGVSPLPFMAGGGLPITVGLALLILAVWRWNRIGAGGRLGRTGVLQAVALGLAAATHQLIWFIAAFLVVALWRLRRGELDRRPAALVTLRYLGVAIGSFAVVNLPFAVADPGSWFRGVLAPLTQHAFFNGTGFWSFTVRVVGHSSRLDFYGYAAAIAVLTLLAATALYPRQMSLLVLLVPPVVFVFSLRSQVLYLQTFLPVLVFGLVGTGLHAFATAKPLRLPARLTSQARPAVVVLGAVAAFACLCVAVAAPAPLRLKVLSMAPAADPSRIMSLRVRVTNESDSPIAPHFTTIPADGPSLYWWQLSGRTSLAPGQSTVALLVPPNGSVKVTSTKPVRLLVVSDDPQTLSSVDLTLPRTQR